MINRHQSTRLLSVPTVTHRNDGMSEKGTCYRNDQLSVRTLESMGPVFAHCPLG